MTSIPASRLDDPPADPFELFGSWYRDAAGCERHELTAMTLATAADDGRVSARIVLLKHYDRDGFVFYTNLGSRKSMQIESNPHAALLFWWPVLQREVRIEGAVTRVTDAEADAYFATRPRGSQLGAWASRQSAPLESRAVLAARLDEFEQRHSGTAVPRPPFWGGWRVVPDWFEYWHEGDARLHDRITYSRATGGWSVQRLYP